jgi:hypothetical protein
MFNLPNGVARAATFSIAVRDIDRRAVSQRLTVAVL